MLQNHVTQLCNNILIPKNTSSSILKLRPCQFQAWLSKIWEQSMESTQQKLQPEINHLNKISWRLTSKSIIFENKWPKRDFTHRKIIEFLTYKNRTVFIPFSQFECHENLIPSCSFLEIDHMPNCESWVQPFISEHLNAVKNFE